jgi:hypothetical protein
LPAQRRRGEARTRDLALFAARKAIDVELAPQLRTNMNRQYSELQYLDNLVSDKRLPAEYRDSLVQLNNELSKTTKTEEMKGYWEAVSSVLGARKKLTTDLSRRLNLAIN